MADLSALLAVLEHHPDDTQAFAALEAAVRAAAPDVRGPRLAAARKVLTDTGRPDIVVELLDAAIDAPPGKPGRFTRARADSLRFSPLEAALHWRRSGGELAAATFR